MSDTNSDSPVGGARRQVGDYEIIDEIGAGGMSRVYRARHVHTGAIVAVKAMSVENTAPDFEARMRREPEIQQGIGHENIVHLLESFRDRDQFYLVMEYIDGRSLAALIHREAGPLPFDRARHYMRQILRGLDHLHHLGIVHRDIKPSNILIARNDVAKLADFGIAKYTWQEAQTSTQRGIGTPEYMSPEQARGRHVDHRTDIYSLGITLYEALTGRRPFARNEATPAAYGEVIQEILEKPLPDPRAFVPSIPPEVVRLLNKATAKDPSDRFGSCAEFLGALEIVEGSPAAAPAPQPAPQPNPQPAQYASEMSAPTVVAGAMPTPPAHTGAPQAVPPRPAQPEPARRSPWPWVLLALLLGVGGYFGWQWYRNTYGRQPLTDVEALSVSKSVAGDVKKYTVDGNAPALASLYDSTNVEFFKYRSTNRRVILDDLTKFAARIVRTEQYDIEVKRARALNDSTIETEWVITYQRMRNDSTLLRGTTSNITTLRRVDGQWLIGGQREKWTKRDNVAAPKPTVDSTKAEDSLTVENIKPNALDEGTKMSTYRLFVSMLLAGDADQAWNTYATGALRESGDRTRITSELAGNGYELTDVVMEGGSVAAKVVRTDADGTQHVVWLTGTVADDAGTPRVATLRMGTR